MKYLEEITKSCEYVAQHSKHVMINEEAIDNLVNQHFMKKQDHWLSSNPFGLLDYSLCDIVNFLIILSSIDCSFWGEPKWTLLTKENTKVDGAFALIYALLQIRKEKGHLDFEQISFEEFRNFFTGNVEIPLLKERYQVVKEVSYIINTKMNGNFYEYIKDITKDIDLLNLIIENFPSFSDTRTYNGKTIYFYKLAGLVVSDILHIIELKENRLVDYSHLVGCADYKIPQILRGLNILEYDLELAELVDKLQEIEENSNYEVEIRANMIVALKKIKEKLPNDLTLIDLNDIIWKMGQDKTKHFKPYHRTRTLSY